MFICIEMLQVTKTFLPPISEYTSYLQRAYDAGWITNKGELLIELTEKLKRYLDLEHITLVTNGTLPLQIAIKALGLSGEIITTPFSYVATTSVIAWESCIPIFVDIEPKYLTIDPTKIEAAITEKTTAILATHVYGNPCDVEAIEKIAEQHNLKVIYDAAHCFGVKYKGKSIFTYGDISTCSFHATKVFHTGEGGCMISNNNELQEKLYTHQNFGHKTSYTFYGKGINGKMSELQAAMGLAVFDHIPEILLRRQNAVEYYNKAFQNESDVQIINLRKGTEWNNAYYPIVLKTEELLNKVMAACNTEYIYPRRYFYPALNTLNYVNYKEMPIAESIAKRVICLPLSAEITSQEQDLVIATVLKELR